jgi:hypothetical protein
MRILRSMAANLFQPRSSKDPIRSGVNVLTCELLDRFIGSSSSADFISSSLDDSSTITVQIFDVRSHAEVALRGTAVIPVKDSLPHSDETIRTLYMCFCSKGLGYLIAESLFRASSQNVCTNFAGLADIFANQVLSWYHGVASPKNKLPSHLSIQISLLVMKERM